MTEIFWAPIVGGKLGEMHKVEGTRVWRSDVREYLRVMHPEINGDDIFEGVDDDKDPSFDPFWDMMVVNVYTVCKNGMPWQLWFAADEEFDFLTDISADEDKVIVHYDFGKGKHFKGDVNSMWTIAHPDYDFTVYAECVAADAVNGVFTDYGYDALKAAVTKAFEARGGKAEELLFWYDGHEDEKADLAVDPVEVYVEYRDGAPWAKGVATPDDDEEEYCDEDDEDEGF